MKKLGSNIFGAGKISRWLLIACLFVWLGFVLPLDAVAAPPAPSGAESCVECHQEETTAWQDSPHAGAGDEHGATCEGCHGAYVESHPGEGVMRLAVDSSVCEECHSDTFAQWQGTVHADAGVQCIGCHLSHSQEFRLTDESLCGSCHRERLQDFSHTAHDIANVGCTDCHVSSLSPVDTETAGLSVSQAMRAPSHDFTHVASEDCITCHGPDVHTLLPASDQVVNAQVLDMAEQVPELTAELEKTRQSNQTLQIMAPVALGIGLGIGGVLGIAFMLVIGYINQRRTNE